MTPRDPDRRVGVEQMLAGAHDPGTGARARRPSLRDVSERAGVALSTASRAMAGAGTVRPDLRVRVLAAAKELGYEPNLLAQSLRSGASMSVGFVARDISNPTMAEIVLGAERVLRSAGYTLSITNSEGEPALEAAYIRYFRQRAVDGLIISHSDESHVPTLDELRMLASPFVAVDRDIPEGVGGVAVLSDHTQGTEVAARYLASLGHRTIALLAGPRDLRPGRDAGRALAEFCASVPGLTPLIEHSPLTSPHLGGDERRFGELATSRALTSAQRPTAIIAGGYRILLGVLASLRAFGLAVPSDISVVVFDDHDSLAFFEPPVTALSREPVEIGRSAAKLLLAQIEGETPSDVVISPIFRPRASTGPPPVR